MPGRGNGRGRGRGQGNFKPSGRTGGESVHDRLGKVVIYPRSNNSNSKKYKFVRASTVNTSSIVQLPGDARIKMITKKFLKSYYEVFDTPGRANLESLYVPESSFSFSATDPMPTYGRNFLKVQEATSLNSYFIHGHKNIAIALASFAPTQHTVDFISYDVTHYVATPMSIKSMHIVLTGVFKDTSETTNPLKGFSRSFLLREVTIDKQGDPVYQIVSDIFMLQPPTPDDIKKYHHDSQIMKRLSNQHEKGGSSTTTDSTTKMKDNMVKSIMSKTRMNNRGSRQLLEDCNWDEEKSMSTFNILFKDNKIPQDFFTP